jgi:hypothetical protein
MPYRLSREQHEKLSDVINRAENVRDHVEANVESVNKTIADIWYKLESAVGHHDMVMREADGLVTAIADDIERWIEVNRGIVDQSEIVEAMELHDEYIQCKTLPLELRVNRDFSYENPIRLDNEYNELVSELESVWRYL